jgi:DNA-directed RNA polymerase specialized sigma subunit
MSATATLDTPAEETYAGVRKLLLKLCWSYKRKFGGEMEELLSLANEGFVRAWRSWQPGKGNRFSTHCYNMVRWTLVSHLRESNRESHKPATTLLPLEEVAADRRCEGSKWEPEARRDIDLKAVLEGLGTDAATIIELALALPDYQRHESKLRKSLVETLLKLGWSVGRIKKGWREIREVLLT